MMWNQRLFLTTRGKVLLLLKRRGFCTVAHLSRELELTPNAIRQHLSALERDNLISQQPLRVGPSKPALAYSLTPKAESLFPKQYDALLSKLVNELVLQQGSAAVGDLLARLGCSTAEAHRDRVNQLDLRDRVAEVRRIIEERGSIAEVEERDREFLMRDYNCPYAAVARVHPEVCQVQSSFLQHLLAPAEVAVGCVHQETLCEFRIRLPESETTTHQS
ncbi:MAG: helix-turn-helix transcriptional regulator [Dehalococcoidia bacterium]